MGISDDVQLVHRQLGWSREVRRFEEVLAHRRDRSAGELVRAGQEILRLLPESNAYSPYRAAIIRLLEDGRAIGR